MEEVCRDRPEEDQIASSYLRCGSLKAGTLRGREKADMAMDGIRMRNKEQRQRVIVLRKGEVQFKLRIVMQGLVSFEAIFCRKCEEGNDSCSRGCASRLCMPGAGQESSPCSP